MLVHGLVVQGEGSTHLVEQESVVPQPKSPTQTNVADESASTGVDVRLRGATTNFTGLEAGQGSGNIDKTPTMPYDSPRPMIHLAQQVVALETDLTQTKKIYGAAFTKLIKKVKTLEKTVKSSQARRKVQGRHEHDIEPDFEFTTPEEVYTAEKGVSTAEPVSTAGALVSTTSASLAKEKLNANNQRPIHFQGVNNQLIQPPRIKGYTPFGKYCGKRGIVDSARPLKRD
ncbi:hypothetical protein Tco_1260523 [Tanacetum coccineum]